MINNYRLKISALFLAVLLWLYASGADTPNILSWGSSGEEAIVVTVPLQTRNLNPALVISNLPQKVKIQCYGNDLLGKSTFPVEAFVDCENLEPGQYWLNILVDLPKDVELAMVNPSMLLVTVEGLSFGRN